VSIRGSIFSGIGENGLPVLLFLGLTILVLRANVHGLGLLAAETGFTVGQLQSGALVLLSVFLGSVAMAGFVSFGHRYAHGRLLRMGEAVSPRLAAWLDSRSAPMVDALRVAVRGAEGLLAGMEAASGGLSPENRGVLHDVRK
jgi:hypothetical protein